MRAIDPHSAIVVTAGLILTCAAVIIATTSNTVDAFSVVLGPILFAVSLPVLAREARRQGDQRVYRMLSVALAVKLLFSLVRFYVTYRIYGGADAARYYHAGVDLSTRFRVGDYHAGLQSLQGSDFMRFVSGVVYTFIPHSSRIGGFLIFSWASFWGFFLFYRAYLIAVPEGRARTYAYLVFFLPSLLYWPSSVGKEAWMVLTMGIAAYGAARVLSDAGRGLGIAILGIWLSALVRPHIAAMLALSLAVGYLARRPSARLRQLAPLAKVLSLLIVGALAVIFVGKAQTFLMKSTSGTTGLVPTLVAVAARSSQGGSAFHPTIVRSPVDLPMATLTVLFRPFITEAHNAQALFAAAITTGLLVFCVLRVRWFIAAVKTVRRQPYVAFAFIFVGLFIVAYSAFPNFGLLDRQRIQVLPLLFVLFTIPPRIKRGYRRRGTSEPISQTLDTQPTSGH